MNEQVQAMMRHRKYENISEAQICSTVKKLPLLVYTATNTGVEVICCIVASVVPCGKNEMLALLESFTLEARHLIVVCKPNLNFPAIVAATNVNNKGFSLELLEPSDLFCDKPSVGFVPLMKRVDASRVLKKLHLDDVQKLPKLLRTDAMVIYYGFKQGDVIRCTSKGSLSQVHYRVVL